MRNAEFQMIIRVTDLFLKDALLAKAKSLGLTISNDGETQTGIEHIQLGNSISVGTSDKFHVNWARNITYYADRGIVPVYDITYDWAKIVSRLEGYAANVDKIEEVEEEENNDQILDSGDSVTVDDGFVYFNGNMLDSSDLRALALLAENGTTITIDTDDSTIDVNGVSITQDEIDELVGQLEA